MALHRYWRVSGLRPYDGGSTVQLSELWLLNGPTRADSGATLTANVAPLSGTLANLQDGNPATLATLAAGCTVTWDFGVAAEITNIQVGAGDTLARFLLGCAVERSDDGVIWREFQLVRNWQGIRWPGARMLTANVLRIPPIDWLTIRMSFEPTSWWVNEFGPALVFTVVSGAVALTSGQIQGARSLQVSGTGLLRIDSTSLFPAVTGMDFTIQARIRATDGTTGQRTIASFGGTSSVTHYVSLSLNPSTGQLQLVVSGASGVTLRFVVSPTGTIALNTNYHIAATSENGTLRLFVNGVLIATSTGANILGIPPSTSLSIGGFGGNATNTFLGVIDEVGIDQKCLYFNDFTPPAYVVPQLEWQIDALTFAPTAPSPRVAIATAGATPLPFSVAPRFPARGRYDYVLGPAARGRVKGTTKDKGSPNVPVSERVRLYRERDGLLVRETWSAAGTGAYSFDYVDENDAYTVISYDHDKTFRAVVADNLTVAGGGVELIA